MESNSLRISYKWLLPAYCSPNKEETRQVSWRNLNSIAVKLNGGDLLSRYIKVKQRRNLPIRINAANSVIRLINTQFLATHIYTWHRFHTACLHTRVIALIRKRGFHLPLSPIFSIIIKDVSLDTVRNCLHIPRMLANSRFNFPPIRPSINKLVPEINRPFSRVSARDRSGNVLCVSCIATSNRRIEPFRSLRSRESIWRIFEIRREEVSSPQALTPLLDKGKGGSVDR